MCRVILLGKHSITKWWQKGYPTLICYCVPTKVSLLTMEQTPRPRTGNIGSKNKAKNSTTKLMVRLLLRT